MAVMADPVNPLFPRVQSEPTFRLLGRRESADTGIGSIRSSASSGVSTRSSSPTASLTSQPRTLIDKIQARETSSGGRNRLE